MNQYIEKARKAEKDFETVLLKNNPNTAHYIKQNPVFVYRKKVIEFWDQLNDADKKLYEFKSLKQLGKLMSDKKLNKEIVVEIHEGGKIKKFKTKIKNLWK